MIDDDKCATLRKSTVASGHFMAGIAVLPPSVAHQVRRAKAATDRLEQCLKPLMRLQSDEIDKMTAQQQAELHLSIAQGLAAVYILFSKVSGAAADGFEKERVLLERYAKKVRVAGNELELSTSSRSLTIDLAAANRFIDAAVPDLDRCAQSPEAVSSPKRQKTQSTETSKNVQEAARQEAARKEASKAAASLMYEMLGLNQRS